MKGTKQFFARKPKKAFAIQKSREGFVRVAEINGVTGEILRIKKVKRFQPKFRAYVRRCWSGFITPLTFEFTH